MLVVVAVIAVGCGGTQPAEETKPTAISVQGDVRAAVRENVRLLNDGQLEKWCQSLYFVWAPGRDDTNFVDLRRATPFAEASDDLQTDCVSSDYLPPPTRNLQFVSTEVDGDRARVQVSYKQRGAREQSTILLRRFDGRWLVRYRLQ